MLGQVSGIARAREAMHAGDFATAAELYRRQLRKQPNSADLLAHLGVAEVYLGDVEGGRKKLLKAQRIAPKDAEVLRQIAMSYWMQGRLDDAIRYLDKALAQKRGDPSLLGSKADMYFFKGEYERALGLLEPVIEQPAKDISSVSVYAKLCRRLKRHEEALERVRRRMEESRLAPADRSTLLFICGAILNEMGRHDEAWTAYKEANDLRGSSFDPDFFHAKIDEMIASWTPQALERLPRARARSDLPVFIVGMMRSGTSLVEQIIATHPKAFGAGELSDMRNVVADLMGITTHEMPFMTNPGAIRPAAFDRGSRAYLSRLRKFAPWATRISDKHPFNAMHLGPIALMLPGAHVVHCLRDPIDTCLSCYLHNFAGASTMFCDLSHLGHFYRGYRRLADHWHEVLDIPILEFRYEDLVEDQEGQTRRLIDFIGLEWDEACMYFYETDRVTMTASNEQVRRPIYKTAVKRWKKYEEHLGPLIEALGPLAE